MSKADVLSNTRSVRDATYMPYVVSADLGLLLGRWARTSGFVAPSEAFLQDLRANFLAYLRRIFPTLEFLEENELERGLNALTHKYDLPVVTMDRVYVRGGFRVDLTRGVHADRSDAGVLSRFGARSEGEQIDAVVQGLSGSGNEVVLADDSLFTGGSATRVIRSLAQKGISVRFFCAAVGTTEGVQHVSALVRRVECVRLFPRLVDQVCERDFYPGVPFSGRSVAGGENVGMPYVEPFGSPERWASIPRPKARAFSRFCVGQTIWLFAEIEKQSGRSVLHSDLPRKVHGIPHDEGGSFVDALKVFERHL